jgi:hypothetical protein
MQREFLEAREVTKAGAVQWAVTAELRQVRQPPQRLQGLVVHAFFSQVQCLEGAKATNPLQTLASDADIHEPQTLQPDQRQQGGTHRVPKGDIRDRQCLQLGQRSDVGEVLHRKVHPPQSELLEMLEVAQERQLQSYVIGPDDQGLDPALVSGPQAPRPQFDVGDMEVSQSFVSEDAAKIRVDHSAGDGETNQ